MGLDAEVRGSSSSTNYGLAGRDVIALVLESPTSSNRYVWLSSRPATTNRPEIFVVR